MNNKTAIFPGSFYPFTIGHLDILEQALNVFDLIVVVWAKHPTKKYSDELYQLVLEQQERLKEKFGNRIEIVNSSDLTVQVAFEYNAGWIIRGLRNSSDFEYEKNLANANKILAPDIKTMLLLPSNIALEPISATFVRELINRNLDYKQFIV